jgi:hypothetical protein
LFFTELAKVFLTLCTNLGVCTGFEFPVKLRVRIGSVIGRIEGGGGDITILGRAPVLTGIITAGAIWLVERTGVCKEVTVVVVLDITVWDPNEPGKMGWDTVVWVGKAFGLITWGEVWTVIGVEAYEIESWSIVSYPNNINSKRS